jgi:hypothetical protein
MIVNVNRERLAFRRSRKPLGNAKGVMVARRVDGFTAWKLILERKEFAMFSLILYDRNRRMLSCEEYPTMQEAMKAGEHAKRFGIPAGICPDCGEFHPGVPASRIVDMSVISPVMEFGLDD